MSNLQSFWNRITSPPTPTHAALSEKRRIYITNAAASFIGLLGPIFIVANVLKGLYPLAWINGASTSVAIVSLILVRCGRSFPAAVLLLVGTGVIFTYSAARFYNGMEYPLLVSMLGAVFMIDSRILRFCLTSLNATGFFVVKLLQFHPENPAEFPLGRYAINLVVFLLCYYVVLEVLRRAHAKYHQQIEKQNAELDDSRRQLADEHHQLTLRTEALREANEAKEKLFSIIAHDLRGPIASVKGIMELFRDGQANATLFHQLLDDLIHNVDHVYECLDKLLTWSASQLRTIQPHPVEVRPAEVTDDCFQLLAGFATRKQIQLLNQIPRDVRVRVDENQVAIILRNLIANALKFTPSGGRIGVSAIAENDLLRITVADTGVGMSPKALHNLFHSLIGKSSLGTENEQGFGLGLTICREFVEGNGGTIFAESSVGSGSRFHFTLPYLDPANAPANPTLSAP